MSFVRVRGGKDLLWLGPAGNYLGIQLPSLNFCFMYGVDSLSNGDS